MTHEIREKMEYLFKGENSDLRVTDPEWVDITVNFS